jgi:CubicO group peptidase (beta-lactamase class C family)
MIIRAVNKIVSVMLLAGLMQNLNAQMQGAVESIRNEFNIMGLSVAVVCDGKLTGTWHAGLRDYERDLPVNENTKYRIASISKFVMTTAMMKLVDSRMLDLDEDISTYLGYPVRNPNHPDKPITVRMLLLHTSSVNEGSGYDPFLMDTYGNVGNPPSFTELLSPGGSYYTEDMWRKEAPGSYYSYCNANFGLAGTIIERITGQRFENYMQQNLFIPLGITGSYIPEGVTDINNLAVIYRYIDGVWTPQTDDYRGVMSSPRDFSGYTAGTNGAVFSPQGGLRISAAELARIMILHLNGGKYDGKRIVSRRSIKLMQKAWWTSDGTNGEAEEARSFSRGLSVHILPVPAPDEPLPQGVRMIGHTGSAYGLFSALFFDPAGKYGFIIIMNGIRDGVFKKPSHSFYDFQDALLKALRENDLLPCR